MSAQGFHHADAIQIADGSPLAQALERARVVGVLDAWTAAVPGMRECRVSKTLGEVSRSHTCQLFEHARGSKYFYGHNPDAARAAAAKAISEGKV